ncbi:MAG: tyrosine-type recombinase/integrase, partial [Myxococcales bacterium]|nr:tyrosine-type recombinase/integrase [Myxococcales bacterium]
KQSTSEYLALQLKGWLPIRTLATSISEATARALYAALVEQVSPRTKRVWTHYYNAQVRTLCRRAGVPEVVPHSLRGFDATLALEGGATADAVAKALGYSSFAMTEQHYTSPSSVSNSRSSRVAQTLGGVGKWFTELLNLLSEIDLQNLLTELQTRGARKETSVGDDAT